MLSRKFKTVLFNKTTNCHVVYKPVVSSRSFSKWFDILSNSNFYTVKLNIFRDIVISRILNSWSRSFIVNSVVRRCRRDRGVRDVLQYFRHVFLKPRRTHLLVTVTAAYKKTEEKPGPPKKCSRNIKDKEMEKLITDLDGIDELSKATLFCEGCSRRVVIDNQHPGVRYCTCPDAKPPQNSYEGWEPYMEAEDVIIWRKEYKPGGLYAYKVYGRYKQIRAEDFAMIQVDGGYRKVWDTAVASLAVVERQANGVKDQDVLHWEVLWPRLFANRDYVYIRRYKEFDIESTCLKYKDNIFESEKKCTPQIKLDERPSVHSHAKKISLEKDLIEQNKSTDSSAKDNKVFVIVSKSCVHPNVPESKNAIRVLEYWSHMVITTLNGPEEAGMEFVLTYYDEPAVGGLPAAVTSWAMGRAGPAFLARMRSAAQQYHDWRRTDGHAQNTPDYTGFGGEKVSFDNKEPIVIDAEPVSESDMESSKLGPDLESEEKKHGDSKPEVQAKETPCEVIVTPSIGNDSQTEADIPVKLEDVSNKLDKDSSIESGVPERDSNIESVVSEREEDTDEKRGWWKYLYPLYYFV